MKNSQILKLHQQILDGFKTTEDLYNDFNTPDTYNAVLTNVPFQSPDESKKNSLLYGIPYTLKDNISTLGIRTTGGSKFLRNYIPPFSATVYEKLQDNGAVLVGKTNLDEFGLGGTGTFSGYGIVKNPFDDHRISGGSSSGSSVSVATGHSVFSIATDTGDSIRKPASYLGIVGYKPSYGIVSRYGVFPYAPSFDHVGILTKSVTDVAIVLDAITGFDEHDYSMEKISGHFFENLKTLSKIKIVVLDDVFDYLNPEFKPSFDALIEKLSGKYHIVHQNFGIELLKIIDPIYQTMSYSEAASSWNNLTGITFGNGNKELGYEDLIHEMRTKYLGSQLKKRFVIGNWCTSNENFDQIYLKSRRIIEIITARAKEILKECDVVLMPGASDIALKLADVLENKIFINVCDDALQIANFGGFPSITIPFINIDGKNFLGLNLWSDHLTDQKLLNIAKTLEEYTEDVK